MKRMFALSIAFLVMLSQSLYAASWKLDRVATMIDEKSDVRLEVCGDVPGSLQWESDNEAVAKVDAKGVVKGISHGDAVVTALCPETGEKATCIVSVGYEGGNPILPPSWGLYIADGEPHVFDGRMYIFGSRDNYDGVDEHGIFDWCSDDYHVIWSDDLIHWTDAGVALEMKDIPEEVKGEATRLWAPDVFRDPVTGKYHMATCTNRNRNIMLDADRPEGPYYNPRLITLNGEPWNSIDPGVLVDDDGKVYIALPKFIVAQLDPDDYSRILPETVRDLIPVMPKDNEPFEGPSLRKRGDTYYYIYIQNVGNIKKDGACPTRMAYLTSKNPLGPYEYQGLIVKSYEYPNAGNVHGSIEPFEGQWYVSYHRSVPDLRLSRTANMEFLEFNEDGTIQQVRMTTSGVRGAFEAGDVIKASGAVEYSEGRDSEIYRTVGNGAAIMAYSKAEQWTGYCYVDFTKKMSSISARVSADRAGGQLAVRRDSPDGETVAVVDVPVTGEEWAEVTVPLKPQKQGRDSFYIVATKVPAGSEVRIEQLSFNGPVK